MTTEILTPEQSFGHLETQQLGRLVARNHDELEIFPVNYVTDRKNLYFRTAEGTKLSAITLDNNVLFEVDHVADGQAWSVIIKGTAERVLDYTEERYIDNLSLNPWVPTLKYNYVRIVPQEISGRQFQLGEEPERY